MKKPIVYAFVPAKGTSERVENKNMRFLAGERLYIRALKTLLKCHEIDRVFLDTESEEMYELANYLPITFMKRDTNLASNKIDGHQMFINEIKHYPNADIYVQLLCTSPFIKPDTIDRALRELKKDSTKDSAILMKKEKCYVWKDKMPTYDINHIPNSKDLPDTITESMGLYIHRRESALKLNRRYGNNPLLIFGSSEELVDVNTPQDLEFANKLAKGDATQEIQQLHLLKHFISSSQLADILDQTSETFHTCAGKVIHDWKYNLPNCKLFGRANTLRLRKLKKGEDYRGIYNALSSYEGVTNNDIIVVDSELPQYAYFGGLNARLALRAGAVGCIINGNTRDLSETISLQFPVISKGYNPTDIRRRATVDFINKPVILSVGDGTKATIHPHDLLFIDNQAVVVIYQQYEKEVLHAITSLCLAEKNIENDILKGTESFEIYKENGAF